MDINAARNEVKVMVVMDLAAICRKLSENSVVLNNLRVEARELVDEFDSVLPLVGKALLPSTRRARSCWLRWRDF